MDDKALPLGGDKVMLVRTQSKTITIYEADGVEDGAYIPAKSIHIYGRDVLIRLRDVLLELYPLEQK